MLINSGTDSVVDQIDFLCDSDVNSYPLADKIRNVNIGQDAVVSTIIQSDGRWQWDASTHAQLPIAKANLVSGQKDYGFDDTFLIVERVEIFDATGEKKLLTSVDEKDIEVALDAYKSTTGTPDEYDKVGRSVFLYPAPNYNYTDGLFVHFKRNAPNYTVSDTDVEIPFASTYHSILAYQGAIPYCIKYKPERVVAYQIEVQKIMKDIEQFYGRRSNDEKSGLRPLVSDSK